MCPAINHTIHLQNQDIVVNISEAVRAKKLTLRFEPHRHQFKLTIPHKFPQALALQFLESRKDWIAAQYSLKSPLILFQDNEIIPFLGKSLRLKHLNALKTKCQIDSQAELLHIYSASKDIGLTVENWLKLQAKHHINLLATEKANHLKCQIRALRIKELRSRWGSCSIRGNLNFSWRLVLAPYEVFDYVVAHEVSHLQEMNHGPRFWHLVNQLSPYVTYSRDWLYQHGWTLHRYVSQLP